ncbi:MFS general substrate transporter [Xylariaceae sp. FL0594]|nr:MFS general substrate transporter [Xylariaceae sp. FL0594]
MSEQEMGGAVQDVTVKKTRVTLGNVRLRNRETNALILIPAPSADPNDPLNWSQAYKYYIAGVVCLAMLVCNFLAAGPTVAIVETTMDFFPHGNLDSSVSRVAYFFTTTALLQGTGNFIWVPIANKLGRRPVYVISYLLFLAASIWLVFEEQFVGFLIARILLGFASGAAETLAPITIADIFFLHERGTIMALYTAFLSAGVAFGILIDGLALIHNHWRFIYKIATGLVGLVFLLAFFTFPETAFRRDEGRGCSSDSSEAYSTARGVDNDDEVSKIAEAHSIQQQQESPRSEKISYLRSLNIFRGILTEESTVKMFLRPFGAILLPPVLWAALVQSVTIGFLVAVTSNVALAYSQTYGFETYQIGLTFIAALIGSLLGIPAGGLLGDKMADWLTKRNGGIRHPEMRLPAITLSLITTPLALILYGVGVEKKLHWICPTVGLGLLNFSITQGTNVCLVYVIDAYRPIAGEITLTVLGFKSLFGFLLSFYTNPWIAQVGYMNAYGTMAAIAAFVLLFWVPLYIWGRPLRRRTWQWKLISYIHWTNDREVGE